jgi:hypothetical protein
MPFLVFSEQNDQFDWFYRFFAFAFTIGQLLEYESLQFDFADYALSDCEKESKVRFRP